jgi:hypothetical protein
VPAAEVRRRPDVAAALARAGAAGRIHDDHLAVIGVGAGGSRIHELEPAVFAGEAGLLAMTDHAILFAGPCGLRRLPLSEVTGVDTSAWAYDERDGDLSVERQQGYDLAFLAVGGVQRFVDAAKAILASAPRR